MDVGVVSTPMGYFACGHIGGDGGVQVTASHNPAKYNGFKVSKRKAKPVGESTGLAEIRKRMGFLFQNAALFDSMTVGDNVAFPMRRHTDWPESQIREILDRIERPVGALRPESIRRQVELAGAGTGSTRGRDDQRGDEDFLHGHDNLSTRPITSSTAGAKVWIGLSYMTRVIVSRSFGRIQRT